MNIFVIVGAITSAIFADIGNLQSLIASKNWTGLTTNILGLVESVLGSMFAAKNGAEIPQAHVDAVLAKVSAPHLQHGVETDPSHNIGKN
jgi:hypothetical protein